MVDVVEKFLTIIPEDHTYTRYESLYERSVTYTVEPIPLNVIRSSGVDMTPDVKVNVTDLNGGAKKFLNVSGDGDRFKVSAIFDADDTVSGEGDMPVTTNYTPSGVINSVHLTREFRVLDLLDYWFKNWTVFSVVTRAADIPDGLYVCTGNSSRKQTFEGYTIWEIEFTKYTNVVMNLFKNDNKYVTAAKKTYEKNKKKNAKNTKAKQSSSLNSKLGKCDLKNLKYSKSKKVTECTKTLQKYLNKKLGCNLSVDGWYGDATLKQVKKFQEKYKKKYKLTANGKMDKATLNAMTKV